MRACLRLERQGAMVVSPNEDDIVAVTDAFDDCLWASQWSKDLRLASERCDSLVMAYTGADRHYHDIGHVAAMLALLDQHAPAHVDKLPIRWAILYHDVVYDARRSDNEAASADIMERDLAALGVSRGVRERVADLILATRHGESVAQDEAMALLVDIDLAVLASGAEAYDGYAAAIRREYAHVPQEAYRAGRSRVLSGFLDRPALYQTPALHAQWEQPARRNLAREIEALRNG